MRLCLLGTAIAGVVCIACGPPAPRPVVDGVPGIPADRQRALVRADFGLAWPFGVDTGTLACSADAVIFRAGGVNYAVNDAALALGAVPADPILRDEVGRWPSNPLSSMRQGDRMTLFAMLRRCPDESCRRRLRDARGMSDSQLRQVDVEGEERLWPPIPPRKKSLDVVVDAGVKICRP